jgi:hypothetical protein
VELDVLGAVRDLGLGAVRHPGSQGTLAPPVRLAHVACDKRPAVGRGLSHARSVPAMAFHGPALAVVKIESPLWNSQRSLFSFASFGVAAMSATVAWFQRADALRSADRAEVAETAARESAAQALDAHRRASEALEALALLSGPPWRIEWLSNDAYLLTNSSPLPAFDVTLENLAAHSTISGYEGPETVGAKSAIKFLFSASMATGFQRDVLVRWKSEASDTVHEWKHPIPPRGNG